MCAAYLGRSDCLRLLLDRGANIKAADVYGHTALDLAAEFGHSESLGVLLDHRANIGAPKIGAADAWCALNQAVRCNQADCVRVLVERGANPNALSRIFGLRIADLARRRGYEKLVSLLEDDAVIARVRKAWLWNSSPDVLAVRMLARRHLRLDEGPSMKQQEVDMYGDLARLSPDLLAKVARTLVQSHYSTDDYHHTDDGDGSADCDESDDDDDDDESDDDDDDE